MKYYLAYTASLLLFYMGDFVSFFLRFECCSFLYRFYNFLMLSSLDIDDKYNIGIWEVVEEDED